jgi:hypothetical protein
VAAEDSIATDERWKPDLRRGRQCGSHSRGGAVQELGFALDLGVELEQLKDGGTKVWIAGTLLVQQPFALRSIQVDHLLEQRFNDFW